MLLVEYLENGSPDAPLIRIYGTDTEAAAALFRKLEGLAARTIEHVCLTEVPGFREVLSCRLDLHVGTTDIGVFPSSPRTFAWTQRPGGWDLAEPFGGEVAVGSFQWLAGSNSSVPCRTKSLSVVLSFSADGQW